MTDRWKNRRRMAWAALVAGMLFPLLLLWSQSDQLGAVAVPFYLFLTGVVASYIGFASWDDKNFKDVYAREQHKGIES